MPVDALMEYLEGVRIGIVPDAKSGSRNRIDLRFRKVAQTDDLDRAFALVAERSGNSPVTSMRLSFWRRPTATEDRHLAARDETRSEERAPNEMTASQPRITQSGPTFIESITMVCD